MWLARSERRAVGRRSGVRPAGRRVHGRRARQEARRRCSGESGMARCGRGPDTARGVLRRIRYHDVEWLGDHSWRLPRAAPRPAGNRCALHPGRRSRASSGATVPRATRRPPGTSRRVSRMTHSTSPTTSTRTSRRRGHGIVACRRRAERHHSLAVLRVREVEAAAGLPERALVAVGRHPARGLQEPREVEQVPRRNVVLRFVKSFSGATPRAGFRVRVTYSARRPGSRTGSTRTARAGTHSMSPGPPSLGRGRRTLRDPDRHDTRTRDAAAVDDPRAKREGPGTGRHARQASR